MKTRKASGACYSLLVIAGLISGCIGSKYTYSPRDHMVTINSHNNFLRIPIGPCGIDHSWNYNDAFYILLPEGQDRGDASQLEIFQDNNLRTQSGFVALDRAKRTVTINLYLLSDHFDEITTNAFRYNGTFRYVEQDPTEDMMTRKILQKDSQGKQPEFYEPH